MTLREVFGEYLVKGQQGQLVIKFVSDVHLCKLLIEDGEAVHITHGRIDPDSILESLPRKTVEWVNFIAGYPVRKRLDMPLHEKLIKTINSQGSAAAPPPTAPPAAVAKPAPAAETPVDPNAPTVPAGKVVETIDGLTELIGPLGSLLAEQVSTSFNYTPGNPMVESIYNKFVVALSKEIPEDLQTSFLRKFQV